MPSFEFNAVALGNDPEYKHAVRQRQIEEFGSAVTMARVRCLVAH